MLIAIGYFQFWEKPRENREGDLQKQITELKTEIQSHRPEDPIGRFEIINGHLLDYGLLKMDGIYLLDTKTGETKKLIHRTLTYPNGKSEYVEGWEGLFPDADAEISNTQKINPGLVIK